MENPKVLLVDDDVTVQVFLKNVLEKDNFSVSMASSGEKALEMLSQLSPDIILMDVSMPPGMTGYQTCEKIRSNPEYAYLPIMMVTGLHDDESIHYAFTVGATDFATKPINAALIGHRIRYVIRSSGNAIRLKKAEGDILALNKNLEKLVQKRTVALEEALEHLKNTQKELIESAKIASLGQLVSGIAHEMNTPLGIAISAVSYLKTELDGLQKLLLKQYGVNQDVNSTFKSCMEANDLAESNMHRASLLIKTFCNISADQRTSDKAEFEIKTFLQELLNGVKNKHASTNIATALNCPSELKITTYPDVFLEVISALVMNSIQHGFQDKKQGTITVNVTRIADKIEIIYEDDGKGFDKGTEHRIFEPFFTTKRGGTGHPGLGLHIAHNYIKQTLKGNITYIPSEANHSGVNFLIELPIVLE